MQKYQIYDLEVIGNEFDDFEVNSWQKKGIVEVEENISDEQVIELLVTESLLTGYARRRCIVDQQESWIYVSELESGRPLFNLELITE